MKQLMRLLTVLILLVGCLGWFGVSQVKAANLSSVILRSVPAMAEGTTTLRNRADDKLGTEFGGAKLDLNNTNVRAFQKYQGMYPNLATKIVQNAPYQKVEDVLQLSGLSDHQKEVLQANLDNFTVTDVESAFNEGDERYNNGIYK